MIATHSVVKIFTTAAVMLWHYFINLSHSQPITAT